MKKAGLLVTNPGASTQPESSDTLTSASRRSELATLYVIKRFSAIWKSKYADQFNSDADIGNALTEWIGTISQLTGEEIKGGIERCKAKHAWPPEVSEFLAEAKIPKRGGCHKFFPPLLARPKGDSDIAKKYVDLINKSLNTFYKGDG